jgi:hypothetical protein
VVFGYVSGPTACDASWEGDANQKWVRVA